jgi:hypothetical protein
MLRSLAVAVVVHGVAALVLTRFPGMLVDHTARDVEGTLELEVVELPSEEPTPPSPPSEEPPAEADRPTPPPARAEHDDRAHKKITGTPRDPTSRTPYASTDAREPAPSRSATEPGYGLAPANGAAGAQPGGPSSFDVLDPSLGRALGMAEQRAAEARSRDVGGLRASLDQHDAELGLGSAGPVVSVAHEVLQGAPVPNRSRAVLEVVADAMGRVTAVRAVDVDVDRTAWDEATRAMFSALLAKKMHVKPGAKGVVVRVSVKVAIELPSGTPVGPEFTGRGILSFDLADIGAVPRKVVHVYTLDEQRL